ncbi:hypothetical protein EDB19DRAFT_851989 [Suillus lakei]|nr:hypothetical protein EDB19DRAFT_851989 [Suillus lakei]
MSSSNMWSVYPPPNLPAKLRRKSSSASINAPSLFEPDDDDVDSPSPVTSPLPSSSPLSTPISSSPPNHIATRYSHSRSRFQNSSHESHSEFDDTPGSPTPFYRRASTSKYMTHQQISDKYGKYPDSEDEMVDPEPYRSDDLLAWLGPPSPARDVPEDVGCDPESMDIHLRRTYFATSSERGRWQSSPVIPRTYNAKSFTSSPIRPHRGHSTPVKSITRDVKSPLLEFVILSVGNRRAESRTTHSAPHFLQPATAMILKTIVVFRPFLRHLHLLLRYHWQRRSQTIVP